MPPRLAASRTFTFFSVAACRPVASTSQCQRTFTSRGPSALRRKFVSNAQNLYLRGSGNELGRKPASQRSFHSSRRNFAAAKDPYQVLGVTKTASAKEIKDKYYELARKFHPDTNKDSTVKEKFVEIQAAYDTLKDDKKRATYDQFGAASQQAGFDPDAFSNARGPFGAGGFGGFQDFGGFASSGRSQADLFESLFGAFGGGPKGRAHENMRGDDIDINVNISFQDACKGTHKMVNLTPVVNCLTCSGSGLKSGAKRATCGTCGGSGTRTFVIDSGFQMASTCPSCQGAGSTVPRSSQCGDCSGMGKVKLRSEVKVKIPAGVEDGMTVRVPGQGDMPISGSGARGDLLVRVTVAASKQFRRQGIHIHHSTRIPVHVALLGGKVRVPTLEGDVDVRVPAGTQQGEDCILKGRGLPPVHGGERGDLFIQFNVTIPRSLTARQRAILQSYADDVEGVSSGSSAKAAPRPSSGSSDSADTVGLDASGTGEERQKKKSATG